MQVRERIEALDILRGFALFGVLLANLEGWFRTSPQRYWIERHPWPGTANALTDGALEIFVANKFFTMFALLFGAGLAIQMERADARGARFGRLALRRLGVLFALGAAHVALLWAGDVLHQYALVGLLLLLFLRRKPRTIAIASASFFVFTIVATIIVTVVQLASGASITKPPERLVEVRAQIEEAVRIYGHGSWVEILRFRFVDYVREAPGLVPSIFLTLAVFLIGLLVWKRGIVSEPSKHRRTLRRALRWGGAFGLGFSVLALVLKELRHVETLAWIQRGISGFSLAAHTSLSLAYGAGILLLLERGRWRARLAPLGAMGRMALTNYLMQSVICSFLFYGFGLGLYDQLGPAAGALIAIAIYVAQLFLSRFWMARFRFGPVEWLWRSLTYGKAQTMRV